MSRSITCLIAVSALSALLTLTPPTAHAIPAAGDYVFTSGLTGTFTSDGNQLTAWAIQDPLLSTLIWTDTASTTQSAISDTTVSFFTSIGDTSTLLGDVRILQVLFTPEFPSDAFHAQHFVDAGLINFASSPVTYEVVSPTSVPEPSAVVLQGLALGVLALMGYVRRQQRHAGLQVG